MRFPTTAAAALLPPFFKSLRTSPSTVILKSGTVECNRLDTQLLRFLRDALSNYGRRGFVAAVLQVFADVALERRRAGQNPVAGRSDDLRVNMAIRPADHQPVGALLGNARPGFAGAADSSVFLVHVCNPVLSSFSVSNRPALPAIQE